MAIQITNSAGDVSREPNHYFGVKFAQLETFFPK